MPSLALVTQAGAPNSSATATQVQDFDAVGAGTTSTSQVLQVQALPKLYFWLDVSVGGPMTVQPLFALRGDTIVGQDTFLPDADFLPLGPPVVHPGAGTGPLLLVYEMPAVYIQCRCTIGANATTYKLILAASV